jgi:hypothetical protein
MSLARLVFRQLVLLICYLPTHPRDAKLVASLDWYEGVHLVDMANPIMHVGASFQAPVRVIDGQRLETGTV